MSQEREALPTILLSREELLLLLDLLQASHIPGLDEDPLGEMSADQRTLALIWAERALRARQMADYGSDGRLLVQDEVLTAVGTCAYPQKAIHTYHWAGNAETPLRYFGHIRNDNIVVHSRPDAVLHLFSLLPAIEELLVRLATLCQLSEEHSSALSQFSLTAANFVHIRELAEDGDVETAIKQLGEYGVEEVTGRPFATTLASAPNNTIIQIIHHQAGNISQQTDLTIIQQEQLSWLLIPEGENLQIKTITTADFQSLITEKLAS